MQSYNLLIIGCQIPYWESAKFAELHKSKFIKRQNFYSVNNFIFLKPVSHPLLYNSSGTPNLSKIWKQSPVARTGCFYFGCCGAPQAIKVQTWAMTHCTWRDRSIDRYWGDPSQWNKCTGILYFIFSHSQTLTFKQEFKLTLKK